MAIHRLVPFALCFLVGCFPRPYSPSLTDVTKHLAAHYDETFPDAYRGTEVGVLRPRFGAPAIVVDPGGFTLQILQRGAEQAVSAALVRGDLTQAQVRACLSASPSPDCIPLQLTEAPRERVDAVHALRTFTATPSRAASLPRYDLLITTSRATERLHHVVFFRDGAPPEQLTVVHLSDTHLGRHGQRDAIVERLDRAVTAINALHPDAVIITGDLAEQGHSRALELTARNALYRLDAPVLIAIGNHDYGHWPRILHPERPDDGYYNFAGVFHGLRHVVTTIGGWDFVGFDTGPAIYSVRVLCRGIGPEAQQQLSAALDDAAHQGRNVVLFSHAPTRGAFSSKPTATGSHRLGGMNVGGEALEQLMLKSAQRGQQVLHLAGHTHWSDLFVASDDSTRFERVPFDRLPCEVPLRTRASLVSAPSATRISFPTLRHGNAFGMVLLRLGKNGSTSEFLLLDQKEQRLRCPP